MEWKYEAMDKLRCYEAKQCSRDHLREEIKRLNMEIIRLRGATTDSTPVMGGSNTHEDAMVNNIAKRGELKQALITVTKWLNNVDSGLSILGEEERQVLYRFYIHREKGNVERLCEELNLEKATVYRRRDKALHHFTIAMYGVTET